MCNQNAGDDCQSDLNPGLDQFCSRIENMQGFQRWDQPMGDEQFAANECDEIRRCLVLLSEKRGDCA